MSLNNLQKFLDLVDKYMYVGVEYEFDCFYEASYVCVENDGIKFSMGRDEGDSLSFSIEKGKTEFEASFKCDEEFYPNGEKFEDFLKMLRSKYEEIKYDGWQPKKRFAWFKVCASRSTDLSVALKTIVESNDLMEKLASFVY
jgi:hypothetical protein